MEKHNISVLISEEEVQKRVRELAAQISKDYEGESVKLICILLSLIHISEPTRP